MGEIKRKKKHVGGKKNRLVLMQSWSRIRIEKAVFDSEQYSAY